MKHGGDNTMDWGCFIALGPEHLTHNLQTYRFCSASGNSAVECGNCLEIDDQWRRGPVRIKRIRIIPQN